jgi:hypothetical protein
MALELTPQGIFEQFVLVVVRESLSNAAAQLSFTLGGLC